MKWALLIMCAGTVVSSPALANSVLPGSVSSGLLQINAESPQDYINQSESAPGTYAYSATAPGASASGTITISNAQSPSVYAHGTATTSTLNGELASFYASAVLTYQIEILGPGKSVDVSVNGSGNVSASSLAPGSYSNNIMTAGFSVNQGYSVGQGFSVFDDTESINAYNSSGNGIHYNGPTSGAFNETGTYSFDLDTIYTVNILASVQSGISGALAGGTETMTAYVDPQFFIASTVSNPSAFSIVLSPDIGSTPLPAALPLFATGLGCLGLFGWRRKGRAQEVAA